MSKEGQSSQQKSTGVPLLDLKAQYRSIRDEVRQAIDEVCDSQYFVLGPKVQELEAAIASYSGCTYGIGVSSGTDALLVALMALDIGPGAAVITSPYTFFATGGTISRVGARPLFCDIDPASYNLSASSVQHFIDEFCDVQGDRLLHRPSGDVVRTIMPVHLYGQTADMAAIESIAQRYGLSIIEDAAQSIGSEYVDGRRAGSIGDVGCFSFFPSKNLGAFGDAGMCTTNDEKLAERLGIMRVHGGEPKYYHSVIGGNFRLDALQAAVLLVKLPHLDSWTQQRQSNAAFYDAEFAGRDLVGNVATPIVTTGKRHIYNQYVLRVSERDQLREYLQKANIGTEIYYPVPLHLQECFSALGYQKGDCAASEQAADETIALPVYPELTREQQSTVVNSIAAYYGG